MIYRVELSEAALQDLQDFNHQEKLYIIGLLQSFEHTPQPEGIQAVPIAEAADGMAYYLDDRWCKVFYNIYEASHFVRVVAIFKKVSVN